MQNQVNIYVFVKMYLVMRRKTNRYYIYKYLRYAVRYLFNF